MLEMPSDPQLEQIAKVAAEDWETPLTTNQVAAILAAYRVTMDGAKIGTIMHNPENGAIAHRVNVDGLHMWRVTVPSTGEYYQDLQPHLEGWEEVTV
jgi:hypothetical protein